ncbi:MAG: hypothetical protein K0S32_98 [Bacteroidetes bacterium]|nr:hypothetical protein [Bacteroidota bacterium]
MNRTPIFILCLIATCLNIFCQSSNKIDSLKKAGNYEQALNIYLDLIKKDSLNGNLKELSKDYINSAYIYRDIGNYNKSLELLFKALKISEKLNDKTTQGYGNYGIALVYMTIGQKENGAVYINRAIESFSSEPQNIVLANSYNILASILSSEGRHDKALETFVKAAKIFENKDEKENLADVYNNISFMELERGNNPDAFKYAQKALGLYKTMNSAKGMAASYVNLQAIIYNTHVNPLKRVFKKEILYCINYLDSAHLAIEPYKDPEYLLMIYKNKSGVYDYLNRSDSAFVYLQKYQALHDSINSLENKKQIEELKISYESEKKEQDIKLLEKENALLHEKEKKRWLYAAFFIGGSVILIVIILVTVQYRRKKQQAESARDKAVFELQALMAQMNPHFLFNALNSIQDFILEKSKHEAYDYLARFSKLVRMVLNNSEDKMVPLQRELELIRLYVELEQLRFTNGFDFTLDISSGINSDTVEVPTMLIQPYVENAIWHGLMNLNNERKGELSIRIEKNSSLLKIIIQDNGVGRKNAAQYRKEEMHKPVGMKLTERRLQMINKMQGYENASVSVSDLYDKEQKAIGTRVEINLPLL